LLEGALKPGEVELNRILDAIRRRAAEYRQMLPNFICTRKTTGSADRSGRGEWKPVYFTADLLRYVDGVEDVEVLETRGAEPGVATKSQVHVYGEFSGILDQALSERAAAQIEWQGLADLRGVRVHVFRYSVPRERSKHVLALTRTRIVTAYHGLIDAGTMAVRRISLETEDVPPEFPLREAVLTVDFDYVTIAGHEYLLPQSASAYARYGSRRMMKSERVFQNYRRYSSQSKLKFAGPVDP
jgi:uncharacterized protein with HEPN domain